VNVTTAALISELTEEDVMHVLYYYNAGGYRAGSFTTHLIEALDSADNINMARMKAAYPSLVKCVQLAKNDPEGITKLKEVATALNY
jgi:hypothetical protein